MKGEARGLGFKANIATVAVAPFAMTHPTFSSRSSRYSRSGFTLVELLTVIAIIGILAAILIPVVGSVKRSAKNSQCVSNLRQWSTAISLYASDNRGTYFVQGRYPTAASSSITWAVATTNAADWPYGRYIGHYTSGYELRFCPLYDQDYTGNKPITYAITRPRSNNVVWPDATAVPIKQINNPARALLLIDTAPSLITTTPWVSSLADLNARVVPTITTPEFNRHKSTLNALFHDGHVTSVSAADIAANGDRWTRMDN